ncbi:MAG: hypothetical protein H8E55_24555 [Pelagibacterales bacterium]|nr:hypothetical protein [Pelagibacterales bacterium]
MNEEELKCQYCGKPAKMYTSPWGIPATVSVCKFHLWILPFWPVLRLHTIAVVLIIIAIIVYIFF